MSFQAMALGLVFVVIGFRALISPAQNDTFWHLRAGADIWRTGHVPAVDTYSYTAAGLPWPDHEWLWQAFSYGCYRVGGFPFLTVAVAGLILLAALLVYRLCIGTPATRGAGAGARADADLAGLGAAPADRDHAGGGGVGHAAGARAVLGNPAALPLWANVHGGVVLGGLMLLAGTVAAVWRWARTRAAVDRAPRPRPGGGAGPVGPGGLRDAAGVRRVPVRLGVDGAPLRAARSASGARRGPTTPRARSSGWRPRAWSSCWCAAAVRWPRRPGRPGRWSPRCWR